jgi:hypothetical protein
MLANFGIGTLVSASPRPYFINPAEFHQIA